MRKLYKRKLLEGKHSGFTLVELVVVIGILCGILLATGMLFGGCVGVTSDKSGVYTFQVKSKDVMYSTGEDGDRFYRAFSHKGDVFDMRDGWWLTWNSAVNYGKLSVGKMCKVKVVTGYFTCGKYKCITKVINCW